MWATAVVSVSVLDLSVISGNVCDKRTISKNDVSDSQEALAESNFSSDLIHNVPFSFNASGNHGDDCSDENTQERWKKVSHN